MLPESVDAEANRTLALAREVIAAVENRDLDQLLRISDPEVEWNSAFAVTGRPYLGHDGIRRYISDMNDAWEVVRLNIEHEFCLGGVVIFVGRIEYQGLGSGLAGETRHGYVLSFRDGKLTRFRPFADPEKALEAVGLSE